MASDNEYLRAAEALLKIANDMELTQLTDGAGAVDPTADPAPVIPSDGVAADVSFVCSGCGNSVPLSEINAARTEAAGGEAIDPIGEGDSVHCPACEGGVMSSSAGAVPKEAAVSSSPKIQALYRKVPKETFLKALQTPISALERIGEKVIGAVVKAVDESDNNMARQDAISHGVFPIHEEEEFNLKTAGMTDQFSADPHGDESVVTSIVLYALDKGLTSIEELKKAGPSSIGELLTKVQKHMKEDRSLTQPAQFSMQASGLLPALSAALPSKLLSIVKEDASSLNDPHAVAVAQAVQGMTEEDAAKAVHAIIKSNAGSSAGSLKTASAVSYKAMLAAVLGLAAATMAGEGKPAQNMKSDVASKHWVNLVSDVDQASAKNEALRQLVYSLGQYAHNSASNAMDETYTKDKATPADSSVAMGEQMHGKVQDPSSVQPSAPDVWETRSASFAMVAGIDMDRLHRYL